jgi:hypothetical protein
MTWDRRAHHRGHRDHRGELRGFGSEQARHHRIRPAVFHSSQGTADPRPMASPACRLSVHPGFVGGGTRRAATSSAASSGATASAKPNPQRLPPAQRGRGCRGATTATNYFGMHGSPLWGWGALVMSLSSWKRAWDGSALGLGARAADGGVPASGIGSRRGAEARRKCGEGRQR